MYSTTWQTITTLLKNGQSCQQVAAQMHVSFSTVQRLYTTIKHTLPRKYGGHPAKVTPQDRHHLARKVTSGAASTAAELKKSLDLDVCVQTIRNMLKKEGLRSAVKARKPFLSRRQLNTCGLTSKGNSTLMRLHQLGCMSFGRGCRMNGRRYLRRHV
jgi:transposase